MRNSKTLEFFSDINKYQNIEKPSKKLNEAEDNSNIELYMNTWGNYNEYGADTEAIGGGWMSVEQAKEFLEAHENEEPFINDTNNCPIEVDEYDNPLEVIEELEYIENCNNPEALIAIIESTSNNFEENKRIFEDGDYTFFEGVDNDEDLGRRYVDMVGGLDGVTNKENYIDEDAYRESWREAAENSVRKENPDLDEDSEEYEEKVEHYMDIFSEEQLEIDKADGADLSEYFDYEALGRDLGFEGFYFASTGAIQTL